MAGEELIIASLPYLIPLIAKGCQIIFPNGQVIRTTEELDALIAEIEALPHVTPEPEKPGPVTTFINKLLRK